MLSRLSLKCMSSLLFHNSKDQCLHLIKINSLNRHITWICMSILGLWAKPGSQPACEWASWHSRPPAVSAVSRSLQQALMLETAVPAEPHQHGVLNGQGCCSLVYTLILKVVVPHLRSGSSFHCGVESKWVSWGSTWCLHMGSMRE